MKETRLTIRGVVALSPGTISAIIDQPGFQLYWRQRQSVFTSSFRKYIDDLQTPDDSKLSEMYD